MLVYILIIYIYRIYAMPTIVPHSPYPSSGYDTSPDFPTNSLVTSFVSPLVHIIPRSTSGRNSCSTGERGLFDIIWSCLITIFACIYKALHPNVPSQELGWRGRLWLKTKLALYMLIAPELIVYWAAQQWLGARQIAKEMNTIDKEIRWTTVHGYFVQMLAFGRRDDGRPHIWDRYGAVPPSNLKSRGERERWTKQLSLKYLYSEGYIELDSLRSMKEEDIMDRSKGDLLSKIFAILQTSWFTLGCITRHHRRLPLTELEVITLASAVLNGVLYILWWNKPQNVERRHYLTILAEPGPKPEPSDIEDSEEPSLRIRISEWYSSFTRDPFRFIRQLWSKPVSYIYSTLSTDTSDIGVESSKKWDTWTTFLFLLGPVQVEFGTIAGGTVDDITLSCNTQFFAYQTKSKLDYGLTFVFTATFGAIHFIAWNFAFPSRTELVLWRVSCLILLIDPAASLTLWIVGMPLDIDCLGITGFIIPFFSIPLYIFARFCILILAFIVLRDPDPQIFVDIPWTCYIPHL